MKNNETIWLCPNCGSSNAEEQYWVKVNGGEPTTHIDGEYWCPDCETHFHALKEGNQKLWLAQLRLAGEDEDNVVICETEQIAESFAHDFLARAIAFQTDWSLSQLKKRTLDQLDEMANDIAYFHIYQQPVETTSPILEEVSEESSEPDDYEPSEG